MKHTINFMPRFAEKVVTGKKGQTIRKVRKRPIKVGDALRLYTGQRTKEARLLRETACKAVLPVKLTLEPLALIISGDKMDAEYALAFARADGFTDAIEMFVWFADRYGLPFEGVVIMW